MESNQFARETIGKILWIAHRHRQTVIQRMEEIGVRGGAAPALMHLGFHGEMSQSELAKCLSLSTATVSQTLKSMVKAGLVERASDESDARVLRVRLTEAGAAKRDEAKCVFSEVDSDFLCGLSDEEKELLAALLRKIEIHVKGEPA